MNEAPNGRLIAGRYRLISPVGEGGMATLWRAMDEQLEREVAVKILRPQFGADPGFSARFRNEARTAGSLTNPNVVQIYDFGTDAESGDQYIVMQLVDGQDLAAGPPRARRRSRSTRRWPSGSRWPTRSRPRISSGSSTAT